MSKNKCRCDDTMAYCDLSTIEDDKLSVIAFLMLGFSGEMSEREIKRIGEIIEAYLIKKKALDRAFFKCECVDAFGSEIKAYVAWLESILKTEEVGI